MILRYIVKRTKFVCPDDWYLGSCPISGQFLRARVGDLSQAQLAAWLDKDPDTASKYVITQEVPEKVETKKRKTAKNKVDGKQQRTTDAAKTKTQKDSGNIS